VFPLEALDGTPLLDNKPVIKMLTALVLLRRLLCESNTLAVSGAMRRSISKYPLLRLLLQVQCYLKNKDIPSAQNKYEYR